MLKKIILILSFVLISFYSVDLWFSADCSYDWVWKVTDAIEWCLWNWKTNLVETWNNLEVADWFKKVLINWTKKISTFLALWAIFAIAFWSLKMVLSGWEEEKIKKAKDIIKWAIIGLLWVVSAGLLIATVVNIVYKFWNV